MRIGEQVTVGGDDETRPQRIEFGGRQPLPFRSGVKVAIRLAEEDIEEHLDLLVVG